MNEGKRTRVLVVDDSAFARKVMRQVLESDPLLEVVGIARDGLDALEKIAALAPDVITLDLVMPELDGIGVLEALRGLPSAPRAIVVTMSDADSALGVAALVAGAFDLVHKPTALATDRLYELGDELRAKVRLAAAAPRDATARIVPPARIVTPLPTPTVRTSTVKLFVIGASTGGPRAVSQLLNALPATLPVPVCVVVHMPTGYTEAFAGRLDRECALEVLEAREGLAVQAGRVVIARAGIHLRVKAVDGALQCALDVRPMDALHRPSVDVLFESAAVACGPDVVGAVLTGMGTDGALGARAIKEAGGAILVEAESTCVVYGMPRSVVEAGFADEKLPLPQIARALLLRI